MAAPKPKKIHESVLMVLRVFERATEALSAREASDLVGPQEFDPIKTVNNMKTRKLLKTSGRDDEGHPRYVLTKVALKVLDNIQEYAITPLQKAPPGRPPGSKKKGDRAEEAPELNVSNEAALMVSQVTRVLKENEHYREAILKAATTLAAYVGMRLVPMQLPIDETEPN